MSGSLVGKHSFYSTAALTLVTSRSIPDTDERLNVLFADSNSLPRGVNGRQFTLVNHQTDGGHLETEPLCYFLDPRQFRHLTLLERGD